VESDKIAKAREALRQKMSELDQQPQVKAPETAATPAPEPKKAAPAVEPATAAPKPAAVEQPAFSPAVAAAVVESQKLDQAHQALDAKLRELDKQEAAQKAALTQAQVAKTEAPPRAETETPPKAQPKPEKQPVASKPPKQPRGTPVFQPIAGPDLPISSDKQQQLSELLQKYKADELSPEQYHAARAKILGAQ
jgi:hypothetical protein